MYNILRFSAILILTHSALQVYGINEKIYEQFPLDFDFGCSTAAYQIEGAFEEDGKGKSTWDEFTHRIPSPIKNGDTGDVACDSYHKFKEDVDILRGLGVKYYRFSIAWTRICPTGYCKEGVNEKGIKYYKDLIAELIKNGMLPMVTIFHWDLPWGLYEDGIDFTNEKIIEHFVEYARILFKYFPEVAIWVTFNEPRIYCRFSYGEGHMAPGKRESGTLDYLCAFVLLQAHAAVYRMYKKEFPHYKAKISIVLDCQWYEPETTDPEDIAAAERQRQFEYGLFLCPLVHGKWPDEVFERVKFRSELEGSKENRLPEMSKEIGEFIKDTFDHLGMNHYFTFICANDKEGPIKVDYDHDLRVINSRQHNWEISSVGWGIVPWGCRKVLKWVKDKYGPIDIFITEIGVADDGHSLDDTIRIDYYNDYMCEILKAMYIDKVNVIGISIWSLMDNFEWSSGYSAHFGIYHIDFENDASLTRQPKKSVGFFKNLCKTKKVSCERPSRKWDPPSWGPFGKSFFQYDNRILRSELRFKGKFKEIEKHIDKFRNKITEVLQVDKIKDTIGKIKDVFNIDGKKSSFWPFN